MTRLPGIKYGDSVASMGREIPLGQVGAANAEARAYAQVGEGIAAISDAYVAIETEEGENLATEAASALIKADAEIRTNPNIGERLEQMKTAIDQVGEAYGSDLSGTGNRAFENKFVQFAARARDSMAHDAIIEKNDEQRRNTVTSATNMAQSGHLGESLGRITASQLLSESEKTDVKKELRGVHAVSEIDRTIRSGNVFEIDRVLEKLKDEDYSGPLEPAQRRAAVMQLDAERDTLNTEIDEAIEHQRQKDASDLAIGVAMGQAGPAQIEAAFETRDANGNRVIEGGTRTSLYVAYAKGLADRQWAAGASEYVSNSVRTGQRLDRTDTSKGGDVAAVEAAYATAEQEFGAGTPELAQWGANIAKHTGVLPPQMESDLVKMAFSMNPQQTAFQANLFESLERHAPQVLGDVPGPERAVYKTVAAGVRGGGDVEEIVLKAQENAKLPPEQLALNREAYSQQAGSIEDQSGRLQKIIESSAQFGGSWVPFVNAPQATPAMLSSFRSLEQMYFVHNGGNLGLARIQAEQDFGRLYSVTNINGDGQIMPYAPERELGIAPELLSQDLSEFYKRENINPGSAKVAPDLMTARSGIGARTYSILVTNELGVPEVYSKRWAPNATEIFDVHNLRQGDWNRVEQLKKLANIDKNVMERTGIKFERAAEETGDRMQNLGGRLGKIPGQVMNPIKRAFGSDDG